MPRFSAMSGEASETVAAPAAEARLDQSKGAEPQNRREAALLRLARWRSRAPKHYSVAPAAAGNEDLAEPKASTNAIHSLAFVAGMLLLLVKLANLTELSYTMTGAHLKLLYLVSPFAYIGILFGQGLEAALKNRVVLLFVAFFAWMVLSVPFSSWPGGSLADVQSFTLHILPLLFVITALVVSWKQLRMTFGLLAFAALIVVVSSRFFAVESGGRLLLSSSGTIGNSNDLAAHLLFVLPFLLCVVMDGQKSIFFRIISLVAIVYGLYVILGTGSRGALIALGVGVIYFLAVSEMRVRLAFVVASLALAMTLPVFLPSSTKTRLTSIFGESSGEAAESRDSRSYLFWKSVEFSRTHPVFGVGLGQFATVEGYASREQGYAGNWHATHCSWTQISSEIGIPGLLFLLLSLGGALVPLHRCYRNALRAKNVAFARMCFCVMLSAVMTTVSLTFLSQAMNFYFAVIIGLAVTVVRVSRQALAAPALHKAAA